MHPRHRRTAPAVVAAALSVLAAASCGEGPTAGPPRHEPPSDLLQVVTCTVERAALRMRCGVPEGPGSRVIIGGQGQNVTLSSSNVAYNSGTGAFTFDVTVRNLMNEAIGTPDGTTVSPEGVRVFFHAGPTVTGGTGTVSVANADGTATYTGSGQPYYQYGGILVKDQVSDPKSWMLSMPATVTSFSFQVYVAADVQPLVVINEVMANPGNAVQDSVGEYVEVYNRGTRSVNLRDFLVSDNSGTTENTPHAIATDLVLAPGAYAVLGRSTNTAVNGGIDVDYVYVATSQATAMQFSNSAGDVFRLKAPNGVVVDSVGWTTAATSAAANTARELKNPALDNSATDGSNWGPATANYETTNKGTPGSQNTNFTP